MNDNKSRDIFYGVVAVATLIVAIVGATLAYFSISASSNEGAVNAKAAVVSINYNDTQQVTAQATELIPSSLKIMQYYYELALASGDFATTEGTHETNKCQDANNKEVCSVYRFSVSVSDGSKNITAMLRSEDNDFNYLAYAVRDVSSSCTPDATIVVPDPENSVTGTTYADFEANYAQYTSCWLNLGDGKSQGLNRCSNNGENDAPDCYTYDENNIKTYSTSNPTAINSIFGYSNGDAVSKEISGTPKAYDLVLFLKENNNDQNADQGKEYHGTIVVEVVGNEGDSGKITGKATRD